MAKKDPILPKCFTPIKLIPSPKEEYTTEKIHKGIWGNQ